MNFSMNFSRRAVLSGLCALPLLRPGLAATGSEMSPFRYPDPYELTSDDIAWFRSCRSLWVDSEAGAPGLFAPGMTPETILSMSGADYEDFERRMEPIQCAFFLHATFRPGRYALAGGEPEGGSEVEVTETDITLLQHTSWRAFTVDSKRPYGDFTNYPIEMAQALGLPVSTDAEGYAAIDPQLDKRLVALHRKSQLVLQAYVSYAELEPGRRIIPFDGWEAIIAPRCRPVGQEAIARYRAEMAVIAQRLEYEAPGALVVPLINTSAALFASP